MEFILGNERRGKIIVISVFALVIVLFIGIFKLITGSILVGIVLFLVLTFLLLRLVGVYVMYPGSSAYTRADLQIKMSKQISQRMVVFFNSMHFLHMCVVQKKYMTHQNHFDLVAVIANHIKTMKEILGMFEDTLSERKKAMLGHYRAIEDIIEEKGQDQVSISDLIHQPRAIDRIDESTLSRMRQHFLKIENLMKQLHGIIKSYSPPSDTFSYIKFKFFEENLYEIRFSYHTWNMAYNYERFTVQTTDEQTLQTVIIHNLLRKEYFMREAVNKPNSSKKAILFCNPNGVFIQFFGYDNEYIRNYLKLGFNVILWNYRGYGQSTGTPTIVKSQIDATRVYEFYRSQGYDIKIVHGYSIGGAAAVGIFDKISPEEVSNIQILIIDRSFSSIGEMSIQFGPALHNLTKLLFFGDNIDLSKQFQAVRCRKLLIWDNLDEVIPDRASFKNRIIKRRRKGQTSSSIYAFDEDLQANQLNEDVQRDLLHQESANPDFESLAQKLAYTIRKMLQLKISVNSQDRELNAMKFQEKETSSHTCSTSSKGLDNLDYVIKIINELDGGGIELMIDTNQLKTIVENKPQKFYHICQSYVLGLVCYGSYFPLQPFIHDHQRIKEQTLLKLERSMNSLKDRFNIDNSEPSLLFKRDHDFDQLVRNLYHIFFKLSQLVTDYFNEEWFSLHGSLLPTNNGHNCSLTELEIRILNEFIKITIPRQQLPIESIEQQKML